MTDTRTIALEQIGSSVAGVWTEGTIGSPVTVQASGFIGLVYNVQFPGGITWGMTSTSPAHAMGAPIWVSAGTVTFTTTGALGGNLTVYLVDDPSPDLFSSSNPPAPTSLPLTSGLVLPGPGTLAVVLDSTANTTVRGHVSSSVYWTGRVALVVDWQIALATTVSVSSMVATVLQPFFSGLAGGPFGGKARFALDSRYGIPMLSTELVRDGDNPGLFVRSFDQDPEDPEDSYRPRPGEGSIDDDIPG